MTKTRRTLVGISILSILIPAGTFLSLFAAPAASALPAPPGPPNIDVTYVKDYLTYPNWRATPIYVGNNWKTAMPGSDGTHSSYSYPPAVKYCVSMTFNADGKHELIARTATPTSNGIGRTTNVYGRWDGTEQVINLDNDHGNVHKIVCFDDQALGMKIGQGSTDIYGHRSRYVMVQLTDYYGQSSPTAFVGFRDNFNSVYSGCCNNQTMQMDLYRPMGLVDALYTAASLSAYRQGIANSLDYCHSHYANPNWSRVLAAGRDAAVSTIISHSGFVAMGAKVFSPLSVIGFAFSFNLNLNNASDQAVANCMGSQQDYWTSKLVSQKPVVNWG